MRSRKVHWIDKVYAVAARDGLFFSDGWGDVESWRTRMKVGEVWGPDVAIAIRWGRWRRTSSVWVRDGWFVSPVASILPVESQRCWLQMIVPRDFDRRTPMCVQMAATGDEGFSRRRLAMGIPLAKRGMGSILIENPYYGVRRPAAQKGVWVRTVEDLICMGLASIEEARAVLGWLYGQGWHRLCTTGVSMGGHMALMAASLSPYPVASVPCIAAHSAAPIFTEGLMMGGCDWEVLRRSTAGDSDRALLELRALLALTDVTRLRPPVRSDAVVIVSAWQDGYIPDRCAHLMQNHCAGSVLRWVTGGHVSSFLWQRAAFQEAIVRAFARLGHNQWDVGRS